MSSWINIPFYRVSTNLSRIHWRLRGFSTQVVRLVMRSKKKLLEHTHSTCMLIFFCVPSLSVSLPVLWAKSNHDFMASHHKCYVRSRARKNITTANKHSTYSYWDSSKSHFCSGCFHFSLITIIYIITIKYIFMSKKSPAIPGTAWFLSMTNTAH